MFCPFYKNKSVFDEFNNLVRAFGGQPMTEDEFKSADLRNQRAGIDLVSMEAAYRLYDMNGGLFLDKVPNSNSEENPEGIKSKLFYDILNKRGGNLLGAIKEKSSYYSRSFISKHGDWISGKSKNVDINGEPVMDAHKFSSSNYINQFSNFDADIQSKDVLKKLFSGQQISSNELIDHFISNNLVSKSNLPLAQVAAKYSLPIKIDNSLQACAAAFMSRSGSYISLNLSTVRNLSNSKVADIILHEIVHHLTEQALSNPKTSSDIKLKNNTEKLFQKLKSFVDKNPSMYASIDEGLYALTDKYEFIAQLATDQYTRSYMYKLAKQIDGNKNILVRTFNNVINAISGVILNRSIVGSQAEFERLRTQLNAYLSGNNTIDVNNPTSIQSAKRYYQNIDNNTQVNDRTQENVDYISNAEQALSEQQKLANTDQGYYQNISNALKIRLNAIRTAELDPSKKANLTNSTQSQIDLFTTQELSKYDSITSFLRQVVPQLIQDMKDIKDIYYNHKPFTSKDYMFQMHSNIKMYNSIIQQLQSMLSDENEVPQIVREYNKGKLDKDKISVSDVLQIKQDIDNVSSITTASIAILSHMLDKISHDKLTEIAKSVGSREGVEYADTFLTNQVINDDIGTRLLYMGASDSINNEVVRAVSHIINKAIEQSDDETIPVALNMLNAVKNLKLGESQLSLYELDENGQTTGYLVRDLNYGKFWKDYDNAIKDINRQVSEKFKKDGLVLSDANRLPPNDHEEARLMWNELRNQWLEKNANRKYTADYYRIQSQVPYSARKALDQYDSQIKAILAQPGVTDENGIYHYEKLSDEDWKRLKSAIRDKKMLYEDYTIFGTKKTGEELKIARALQKFRKDLSDYREKKTGKKFDPTYDIKNWTKQFNQVIEECGGKQAYNDWFAGNPKHKFDDKKFIKWARRNAKLTYKKDENGDAIIFNEIKNAMRGIDLSFGEEYDKLTEMKKSLLNPLRDQYGEVDGEYLTESVRNIIFEINQKRRAIREKVLSNNKQLSQLYQKHSQLMDKYFDRVNTEYLNDAISEIEASLNPEDGDYEGMLTALLLDYGDTEDGFDINFDEWWMKSVAKDKSKYMEFTPGNGWIVKEDDSAFINKEYVEESKKEGNNNSFIPKRSLYDNSKAFNKIKNSETLSKLYDLTLQYMKESNAMQTNRMFTDDYLLPQIQGSFWKRLKRNKHKWSTFINWLKEQIGISDSVDDSVQYGEGTTSDYNDQEYGNRQSDISTVGKYPDGRRFNILPQYYTRKLQDPSQLSSDLVGMITQYYNMSALYKNKSKIRDDVESLIDAVGKQRFGRGDLVQFSNSKVAKDGTDTRLFKYLNSFVEMNMYDKARIRLNIGSFNYDKTLSLSRRYVTALNLGLNPKVAVVGFLTTMYNHLVFSLTGQRYSAKECMQTMLDVASRFVFKHLFGARTIANPYTKDKMLVVMKDFGLANQWENTTQHTNRIRAIQATYKQSIYGLMSACDVMSKQHIAQSALRAHHFVNGEFLTKYDIQINRFKNGEDWYNDAMKQYKKGVSLWDVIDTSTGAIKMKDDKYKAAWEKSKFKVKNRCVKYSEEADGMATKLQRTLLVKSWAGILLMIHRQYFPLMLDKYFGNRVYDYDMQEYKNGLHRNMFNLISKTTGNNLLLSTLAWSSLGTLFFNPAMGSVIGAAIGVGNYLRVRRNNKKNGIKPEGVIKQVKKYFNDKSSDKAYVNSLSNKYQLKQTMSEIALYAVVNQISAFMYGMAKESDKDDEWWKYMLAYWMEAFKWESFNPYRIDDIANNIKTVSAATSLSDGLENFMQGTATGIANRIFPRQSILSNPSLQNMLEDDSVGDFFTEPLGKRSRSYEGFTKFEKNAIKLTPLHSPIEQFKDSKSKLNYLKMQIEKEQSEN